MAGLRGRVGGEGEGRDGGRLSGLRRAAAHNDPNDFNILVAPMEAGRHWRVTGILDFRDNVHTYAVADLAIAIAYAILGAADPPRAAVLPAPCHQRGAPPAAHPGAS